MEWQYDTFKKLLADFLPEGEAGDPKEMKRRRILAAAAEQFIRHGYRKTNISDVAKAAGVAKGTVYLYVKSKQELLVFAIAEEKKRYMGVMKSILSPDKTPRERLREWIRQVFILGNEMPLTSRVLRGDQEILAAIFDYMDARGDAQYTKIQTGFISFLIREAAADAGLDGDEIAKRATVMLGLAYFSGMLSNDKVRGGLTVDGFAETLADILINGIVAPFSPDGRQNRQGGL